MTFIELLVAIVILGIGVVGVLAAARTTVLGATAEREHAKAHQWLQSASAVIDGVPRELCDLTNDPDGSGIQAIYQTEVSDGARRPDGWDPTTAASIVVSVPRVWNGSAFVPYTDQLSEGECFDTNRLGQQLIEMIVTSPSGEIIETVEVVKRES